MTYCGERTQVNSGRAGGIAVSLRCRSWACESCGVRRRRELIAYAERARPQRLVTLTVNPRIGISPADRASRLARAWRLVVARAKRQLGIGKIEYLAVFEATKRGEPHLHILVKSAFISQKWLSAQMQDILQSPIVDIRRIDTTRNVARYIAKYIGKQPHRFACCKRYWSTRAFGPLREKKGDWNKVVFGEWYTSDKDWNWWALEWCHQPNMIMDIRNQVLRWSWQPLE